MRRKSSIRLQNILALILGSHAIVHNIEIEAMEL